MNKTEKPSASPDRKPDSAPENPVSRGPRAPGACPPTPEDEHLRLPHERDQSRRATASEPDPAMRQAHQDLNEGQVDTDMRATPGLDAQRRARQVPGAGGQRQNAAASGPPSPPAPRATPRKR